MMHTLIWLIITPVCNYYHFSHFCNFCFYSHISLWVCSNQSIKEAYTGGPVAISVGYECCSINNYINIYSVAGQ